MYLIEYYYGMPTFQRDAPEALSHSCPCRRASIRAVTCAPVFAGLTSVASVTVYQAFPAPIPAPSAGPAPASVRRAAYLMYAGAVVYLVSGIVGVISLVNAGPGSPLYAGHDGSSRVSGAGRGVIIAMVLTSIVIPILLWLWMAWKCKAGRPWARIFSTVLFGLGTLATLLSLATTTGFWALLGMIAGWLAGLGATILLWQRSSSWFFRAAPRY
jgi:hypothetical protein